MLHTIRIFSILALTFLMFSSCVGQNRFNIKRKLQKAPGADYLIVSDSTRKSDFVHKDSIINNTDIVIGSDGSISAPNFTNDEIDVIGASSLITKDYADSTYKHVTFSIEPRMTGDTIAGKPVWVEGVLFEFDDLYEIATNYYKFDTGLNPNGKRVISKDFGIEIIHQGNTFKERDLLITYTPTEISVSFTSSSAIDSSKTRNGRYFHWYIITD